MPQAEKEPKEITKLIRCAINANQKNALNDIRKLKRHEITQHNLLQRLIEKPIGLGLAE